jgi:hypothetical protein
MILLSLGMQLHTLYSSIPYCPFDAFASRLCNEQRPHKRDEDGSFIVEVKAHGVSAGGAETPSFGGGECDMDDDHRQQQHAQHSDCLRDVCHHDSTCGGGEERLVESLGAVAINKRRKTGP